MNERQGRFIEINMRRCRLFLTESEILFLLAYNESLWCEAIRRGKAINRTQQANDRLPKVKTRNGGR